MDTKTTAWPFHIYYKDHLFALQQGDPCLGIVKANTEMEAMTQAKAQGLGNGNTIVAAHIPSGNVAYRDVKTGRVRNVGRKADTKHPLWIWYPFVYHDSPGGGKIDPQIKCLALELRITMMKEVIEDYPNWQPHLKKLRDVELLLSCAKAESRQAVSG